MSGIYIAGIKEMVAECGVERSKAGSFTEY
jgi:hypothetical protein